jgi:hypothetical protein
MPVHGPGKKDPFGLQLQVPSPISDHRAHKAKPATNQDFRRVTSAGLTCPRSTNWSRRRIKNDELPKSLRELRCGLGSGLQSCWASRLCSFCSELMISGPVVPAARIRLPTSRSKSFAARRKARRRKASSRAMSVPSAVAGTSRLTLHVSRASSRNRESLPVTDAGLVSHQVHGFHHDQEGRAGFPTDPSWMECFRAY